MIESSKVESYQYQWALEHRGIGRDLPHYAIRDLQARKSLSWNSCNYPSNIVSRISVYLLLDFDVYISTSSEIDKA